MVVRTYVRIFRRNPGSEPVPTCSRTIRAKTGGSPAFHPWGSTDGRPWRRQEEPSGAFLLDRESNILRTKDVLKSWYVVESKSMIGWAASRT